MSNFTFEIGENIKFYRKQRNMTLKELGCKVGITESTMQKYETGQIKRIDIEAVQKISSALDISFTIFCPGNIEASSIKQSSQLVYVESLIDCKASTTILGRL